MAYYGVLMKDGTELTHYGVKGMKWGKRLFGKVKGVFGKPNVPKAKGPVNGFISSDGRPTGRTASYLTYNYGKGHRSEAQNSVVRKQSALAVNARFLRGQKDVPVNRSMISSLNDERRRYSKKLNGR